MTSATTTTRPAIRGVTHMISAGHSLAAAAGYRILEQGGNAIDAGVASGIVINTVLPENTSFGGVAPIMIYDAASDSVVTISGLGRWPRKASATRARTSSLFSATTRSSTRSRPRTSSRSHPVTRAAA